MTGLLRCRRCGRRLTVWYTGAANHVLRYACHRGALDNGDPRCISFGGLVVDAAMAKELLRVVQEALACGLPAAYLDSGGHSELVGEAGLPFAGAEELSDVLARLVDEIDQRRSAIRVSSLAEVADRYLEVLGG